MLALQGKYLGLTRVGHIGGRKPRVYECFPQVELIESERNFCRVNDAFLYCIIRKLENDVRKKISTEAYNEIIKFGNWYIQFQTFSYLRVSGYHGIPLKLQRYL